MQGGFSFCGVDIAEFGMEYVPPLQSTYVFGNGGYQINEQLYEGHHGGYFYGATVPPKQFTLRCMFEDSEIIRGNITRLEGFFYVGRTGRLVFNNRDWLYYTATVVSVSPPELTNRKNGFITIGLKAYYPFGRCEKLYLTDDGLYDYWLADNSGMMEEEYTPVMSFADVDESKNILLYNGGTAPAEVAVAVAGDAGEGVTIKNNSNKTEMKLVVFDKAGTTDAGKYVLCDSLNHKTILTDGTDDSKLYFVAHDHGFLRLEPSCPIRRDVYVDTTLNSKEVYGFNLFNEGMIGHYIYLEGSWQKIVGLKDNSTAILEKPMQLTNYCMTNIVRMNEISIELGVGCKLDKLDFIYKPTFI